VGPAERRFFGAAEAEIPVDAGKRLQDHRVELGTDVDQTPSTLVWLRFGRERRRHAGTGS
jgi:hypothetical protein